jgi:hypothetical protein
VVWYDVYTDLFWIEHGEEGYYGFGVPIHVYRFRYHELLHSPSFIVLQCVVGSTVQRNCVTPDVGFTALQDAKPAIAPAFLEEWKGPNSIYPNKLKRRCSHLWGPRVDGKRRTRGPAL